MSGQGAKARSQAQSARPFIKRVENLQAVMAHADRVGVGKRQADPAANLAMILDHRVQLAAQILGRHLHPRQDVAGQIVFKRLVEHTPGVRDRESGQKLPAIIAVCGGSRTGGRPSPAGDERRPGLSHPTAIASYHRRLDWHRMPAASWTVRCHWPVAVKTRATRGIR